MITTGDDQSCPTLHTVSFSAALCKMSASGAHSGTRRIFHFPLSGHERIFYFPLSGHTLSLAARDKRLSNGSVSVQDYEVDQGAWLEDLRAALEQAEMESSLQQQPFNKMIGARVNDTSREPLSTHLVQPEDQVCPALCRCKSSVCPATHALTQTS